MPDETEKADVTHFVASSQSQLSLFSQDTRYVASMRICCIMGCNGPIFKDVKD